jgi:hypothetical protein
MIPVARNRVSAAEKSDQNRNKGRAPALPLSGRSCSAANLLVRTENGWASVNFSVIAGSKL